MTIFIFVHDNLLWEKVNKSFNTILSSFKLILNHLGSVHKSRDAKISVDPPPRDAFVTLLYFFYLQIKMRFGLYKLVAFHK